MHRNPKPFASFVDRCGPFGALGCKERDIDGSRPIVEMGAVRSDVPYIHNPVLENFILQVKIVLLNQRHTQKLGVGSASEAIAALVIRDHRSAGSCTPGDNLQRAR